MSSVVRAGVPDCWAAIIGYVPDDIIISTRSPHTLSGYASAGIRCVSDNALVRPCICFVNHMAQQVISVPSHASLLCVNTRLPYHRWRVRVGFSCCSASPRRFRQWWRR